ncbi:MAG: hypothetical protein J0L75_11090 [Spirochaetes bacterium]|nr:hypothetical protein [Spirochaetota bacterium]
MNRSVSLMLVVLGAAFLAVSCSAFFTSPSAYQPDSPYGNSSSDPADRDEFTNVYSNYLGFSPDRLYTDGGVLHAFYNNVDSRYSYNALAPSLTFVSASNLYSVDTGFYNYGVLGNDKFLYGPSANSPGYLTKYNSTNFSIVSTSTNSNANPSDFFAVTDTRSIYLRRTDNTTSIDFRMVRYTKGALWPVPVSNDMLMGTSTVKYLALIGVVGERVYLTAEDRFYRRSKIYSFDASLSSPALSEITAFTSTFTNSDVDCKCAAISGNDLYMVVYGPGYKYVLARFNTQTGSFDKMKSSVPWGDRMKVVGGDVLYRANGGDLLGYRVK